MVFSLAPSAPTRWLTWLFIASALLFVFAAQVRPVYDPDVYIHLRDGRFWLESNLAPGADPFTYTLHDQPTEKVEWLFRIGLYALWRSGGWPAVILLSALLTVLLVAGLGALLYRLWPQLGAVSLLLALGIVAPGLPSLPPRPQLFTLLFLLATLWLVAAARGLAHAHPRRAALALAALPVLAVPWANLHPGVVILPVLLTAEWLDAAWSVWVQRRPEARTWFGLLTVVLLLTPAAIALNPQGFGLYAWTLASAQNPLWLRSIVEWMPPELGRKPFFFLLLGLAWLAQVLTITRSRPREILLLLLLTYLSLQSRRHIVLFVILVLPALTSQLRRIGESRAVRLRPLSLAWRRRLLAAAATLALVLTAWGAWHGKWFRLGQSPDDYPHAALQWLQREKPAGRLFCPFHWGGFVGWATHGQMPVFMDGRIPLYPPSVYQEYYDLNYGRPGRMLELLRQYRIETLLLSLQAYPSVFTELDRSQEWALVYWDHVAAIYLRRGGADPALLGREYRYLDPNSLLFFHPDHPDLALAEARRAAAEAPQSYLPRYFTGNLLLRSNDLPSARRELDQVIAVVPSYAPALYDLAVIASQERLWSEAEHRARACVRHASGSPVEANARLLLAELLARQGRRSEARRHALRAQRIDPSLLQANELLDRLR